MSDAIDELIEREGGYVDHPHDRGGPTKYGITQGRLSDWRGRPVTAEEVKALTVEEARTIYVAVYASGLERIEHHPDLYRFVLDLAVLSGPKTAVRLLQAALNGLHLLDLPLLAVDGVLGEQTARAVDQAPVARVIQAMIQARIPALVRIVESDPSQLGFLEGWVTRTLSFLPEVVSG